MSKQYFSGRLFFDHIPKTAGTSLTRWLIDNLGDGTVTPISQINGPHIDLIKKFGGLYPVISGHTQFLNGDDLDPRWTYITLIREPIDRCLSWAYYLRNNVKRDSTNADQIDGAIAFLDSSGKESSVEFLDGITNYYTRHFSSINLSTPASEDDQVLKAIHNLNRYSLVGFQDNLSLFLTGLCELIGINTTSLLAFENVTSNKINRCAVNDQLYSALLKLNALDVEFYKQIKSLNAFALSKRKGELVNNNNNNMLQSFKKTSFQEVLTTESIVPYAIENISGEIILCDVIDSKVVGQSFTIRVNIINGSSQTWGGNFFYPTNASYHWLDSEGEMLIFDGERTPILIYPETSSILPMKVIAPNEAGTYTLVLSIVQENQFWFDLKGNEFIPSKVEVIVTSC